MPTPIRQQIEKMIAAKPQAPIAFLDLGGSNVRLSVTNGATTLHHERREACGNLSTAAEAATKAINEVLAKAAKYKPQACIVMAAGISDEVARAKLQQLIEASGYASDNTCLMTDIDFLMANIPGKQGLAAILGTGSNFRGIHGDLSKRVGGHGPAGGEPGSGYGLGLQLCKTFREVDIEEGGVQTEFYQAAKSMLNEALGDYSPEEERAKKFFHAVILDLNKPCSKAETAQRVRAIASLSSLLFSMGFVERSALALEVIETQAAHAALELAMLIRKLKIPSATVANGIPFVLQGGVITSEHGPKYLNCIAQRLALELKVPKVVFEPIYIKEKESGCVIAAFVDGMRRGLAKKTAPASASSQTFAGGRKQEDSGGGAPADAGPVEGAPTQKVTH